MWSRVICVSETCVCAVAELVLFGLIWACPEIIAFKHVLVRTGWTCLVNSSVEDVFLWHVLCVKHISNMSLWRACEHVSCRQNTFVKDIDGWKRTCLWGKGFPRIVALVGAGTHADVKSSAKSFPPVMPNMHVCKLSMVFSCWEQLWRNQCSRTFVQLKRVREAFFFAWTHESRWQWLCEDVENVWCRMLLWFIAVTRSCRTLLVSNMFSLLKSAVTCVKCVIFMHV